MDNKPLGTLHGRAVVAFTPLGQSGSFNVHYADGGVGVIGAEGLNQWFKPEAQSQVTLENVRPEINDFNMKDPYGMKEKYLGKDFE